MKNMVVYKVWLGHPDGYLMVNAAGESSYTQFPEEATKFTLYQARSICSKKNKEYRKCNSGERVGYEPTNY